MDTILRPEIREALNSFRKRHRGLLAVRAACAFFLAAIPAWILLAMLDRYLLIPDPLRWGLGIAIYAGCLGVAWKAGLETLGTARNPRALARLIEREKPELREELLAAIELGAATAEEAEQTDSLYFRRRLQDDVAEQVRDFNPKKILPFRRVALRLWILALALAAAAGLTFVSGLHFSAFLARAMLPFVNLARPAEVVIRIVEPSPGDRIVPAHEDASVIVELEGRIPRHVFVQIREANGASNRRELARVGERRYSGAIPVRDHDIRYRVLAGVAASRYYDLDVRARPAVASFSKTTRHPAYTGWEDRTEESAHGDLEALAGSNVDLVLRTNDAISSGELRLAGPGPGTERVVTLECPPGEAPRARVPVTAAHDRYSIRLVSADTGLDSADTGPFEIRALPDGPPVVEITAPAGERVEVRPDADLPLRALAVDDIRLAQARRAFRINGGEWRETALPAIDGLRAELAETWYLGDLELEGGDVLFAKFVVADAAGGLGESLPLKIVIVADPVSPAESDWLARQNQVQQDVEALAEAAAEAQKIIEKAKNALQPARRSPNAEEKRDLSLALQAPEQVIELAERARHSVRVALANAPGHTEAMEMRAAGERLAELRSEHLDRLEKALASPDGRQGEREARDFMSRARNAAQSLHSQVRTLLAEDRARILERRLEDLSAQQRQIADANPEKHPRLADQQETALERSESARAEFEKLREETGGNERKIAEQSAKALAKAAESARENAAEDQLGSVAQEMSRQVEQSHQNASRIHDALVSQADEVRERILREASKPSRAIAEAENQAGEVARDMEKSAAQRKRSAPADREKHAAAREELRARLEAAAEFMQEKAALSELTPRGDTQAAADQNRLSRALDSLAGKATATTSPAEARAVADGMKALETIDRTLGAEAMVKETENTLREMAREEIYPGGDPAQTSARNAAEWEGRLEPALELLPQVVSATGAREAAEAARETPRSTPARALDAQMEARRNRGAPAAPAPREVARAAENMTDLAGEIAKVRDAMQPSVAEARARLEEMTPSLAEMMRGLAAEMDAASAANRERANDIEQREPSPAEVAGELTRAMDEGEAAEAGTEDLVQAVRQETNNADLGDPVERNLARAGDAALETLRQTRTDAAATLQQAAASKVSAKEDAPGATAAAALGEAAEQQGEMAGTLERMASVFEQIAARDGTAEDVAQTATQQASREMEENLGIDGPLDSAYERAAELGKMAGMAEGAPDPRELLLALEQELARNPGMQSELGNIAQSRAAEAAGMLRQADSDERTLAQSVDAEAQKLSESPAPAEKNPRAMNPAAAGQEAIAGSVAEAGAMLQQAARHEARLGNAQPGAQLRNEGEAIGQLARGELAEAARALRGDAPAGKKAATTEKAQKALSAALAEMGIDAAPSASGSPSPPSPPFAAAAAEESRALAQALDQIDRQLHPTESAAGSASVPAAESMHAAARMQASTMANARRNGLVPGASSDSAAPASSQTSISTSTATGSEAPSDGTGEGMLGETADAGTLPAAAIHSSREDWGRLPDRVAGDLREGRRQEVSSGFRDAIESYYRAIARRAGGSR